MVLSMGIENLKTASTKFGTQFSLSIASQRKMKQLGKAISLHDVSNYAFPNSNILETNDATSLYFSMPFFGGKLPQTKLVYTTELHVKSFRELFGRVSAQVKSDKVYFSTCDCYFDILLNYFLYILYCYVCSMCL